MNRFLVYLSLVATLTLGAHAEWTIGTAIGLSDLLASVLPVAIDAYVLAALMAERDVGRALLVLALSIGGGHAYIGATEGDTGKAVLGASVGLLLVVVLWRVEELAKPAPEPEAAEQVTVTAQAAAVTGPPAAPPVPVVEPPPVQPAIEARRQPQPRRRRASGDQAALPVDVLELGRQIAAEHAAAGQPLTHRGLVAAFRSREQSIGNERAAVLLRTLQPT